jgi:hypothetical protein
MVNPQMNAKEVEQGIPQPIKKNKVAVVRPILPTPNPKSTIT